MPMNGTLSSVPCPDASSRKRSYAEISRAESRSPSPELPSKRRRTLPSPSISSYDSHTPSPPTPLTRSVRDGFDFRRPIMTAQSPNFPTIDLTAEDDTTASSSLFSSTHGSPAPQEEPAPREEQGYGRAPPFGGGSSAVIYLSDSDDEDVPLATTRIPPAPTAETTVSRISSSPEVEFVGERPARQEPDNRPAHSIVEPSEALQQALADGATFGDLLRRGTRFLFENVNAAAINNLLAARPALQRTISRDHVRAQPGAVDNFEGLRFDYQQPAFAMGDRESETPQVTSEPYKAPPAPKEGFTRNIEEDVILVCPGCGDELATGEDEVKQQVWIVKQCGHVYCGACATNRAVKSKPKETGKLNPGRTLSLKTCAVEGCDKSVTRKGSMFQIYL